MSSEKAQRGEKHTESAMTVGSNLDVFDTIVTPSPLIRMES
jgi:hypothetical protein